MQIDDLGLRDVTYAAPPDVSPRYIYYPDHLVDVLPPILYPQKSIGQVFQALWQTASNVLTEPIYTGLIPSMMHMMQHRRRLVGAQGGLPERTFSNAYPAQDMSIGDFLQLMFGRRDLVDNLGSAVMHGIYGGDIWRLSVTSSLLYNRWLTAVSPPTEPGLNWVRLSDLAPSSLVYNNPGLRNLVHKSQKWGMIGFMNGFGTLTDALVDNLSKNDRVTIKTKDPVKSVRLDRSSGRVQV
jgi:protoporphyrinogen oxidase